MKIIESYNDVELSPEAKKKLYEVSHKQQYKNTIYNLLPEGKSVWIDSAGDCNKANIVAFEHRKWEGIFDHHMPVKYYSKVNSTTMVNAINKYIVPTSIVMYESEEFRYITTKELIDKVCFLHASFNAKLIIYINLIYVDFNKLKYTQSYIIEQVKAQTPPNTIIHHINKFEYLLEINQ